MKKTCKKILLSVTLMMMCIAFVGCGKSEEAQKADDSIQAIGEVSLASGSAIAEAENLYNALPDKDKKKVEYYETLTSAKDEYASICDETKKDIEEKIASQKFIDAYKLIVALPEELKSDADKYSSQIEGECYPNTLLPKLENVSSVSDYSLRDGDAKQGYEKYGYSFDSESSWKTAKNEYFKYVGDNYKNTDHSTDGASSGSISSSVDEYEYEDELGNKIILDFFEFSGFSGFYRMDPMYRITVYTQKDADFKAYETDKNSESQETTTESSADK